MLRSALSLVSSVLPNPTAAGADVVVALTTSAANGKVSNAQLAVSMPIGLVFKQVDSPDCTFVAAQARLTCVLGTLSAGTDKVVRITASATTVATYAHTAGITGDNVANVGTGWQVVVG